MVQGYEYENRLMIETGFLVCSRHKQRDILKGKVSQELSLKLLKLWLGKMPLLLPQTEVKRR